MVVHIVLSFVCYCLVWVACVMTLNWFSVWLPLLLSTPLALILQYFVFHIEVSVSLLPILIFLWLGGVLAVGFIHTCGKKNRILAQDHDMFLTPRYNSIFFEQYMILNREVANKEEEVAKGLLNYVKKQRKIFICSTMYRENATEMKQLLKSIWLVAEQCHSEEGGQQGDSYESHIFFDGAIKAGQIDDFGLQLLALLKENLRITLKECKRRKTPYGYNLKWRIGPKKMPFEIHFKDQTLVKAKKRWSQVMYMNYIMKHRNASDACDASNTFILMTDADISFEPKSVTVLLDMLASNEKVGGVCARSHPKGSGPLYWYQIFDYAIGHWFQKPAEHMLGSVLCSPGCFSVFRCSALKEVLDEYSSESHGATEFLMKDMGEDRWLCTLIIKKGLRLNYCAIANIETYCPTDFSELFRQRRRWIPSTVVNLVQLLSKFKTITSENTFISIFFIFFQLIVMFSTVISPATVILVIAAGLKNYNIPNEATIITCFLISVWYGLVCLYSSPKTQLDISKILTFIFALVMSLVMVGIFKDALDDIVGKEGKIPLGPADCSGFVMGSEAYEECMKGRNFAANFTNGEFQMPVSTPVIYMILLSSTFLIAAILHLSEFYCILHGVIYILALPSGR